MKSIFSTGRRALMALTACVALLLMGGSAFAQSTIKGKVLDSKGEAIIGAAVLVPGTTTGAVTDIDGNFEIRIAPGTTLEVSCIGYVTKKVNAAQGMTVTLDDDSLLLEEAVAVGYGTMRKSDVTGAMVSVNSEQLLSNPANNAVEALQGKAAGVYITSNERPGQVGSITIRGLNSIGANSSETASKNAPLVVIDGVISKNVGMDAINPQDIQDIQVLKDASATAIYGAMGGNGVILVTTKRGTKDRLTLNYSGTVTAEKIYDVVPMMNAQDYIEWRRWGYYYAGLGPRADQPTVENDRKLFTAYGDDATAWGNILKGWGLTYDQWANGATSTNWDASKVTSTDWTQFTDRIGVTQEHSLSASGGTDKMNAYVSIGYLNNKGTNIGQDYTRYTVRTNVDVNPVKWFRMGGALTARFSDQEYGIDNGNGISGSIPSSLHAKGRNVFTYALPYDANGDRILYPGGDSTIPTVIDEVGKSQVSNLRYDVSASFYAQLDFGQMWEPLKGLTFRSNFGPQLRFNQSYRYLSTESVNRISQGQDYVSSSATKYFDWVLDNTLNYNRSFGDHNIGVTLLQEAMANMNTRLYNMSGTGVFMGWDQKWWGLNSKSVGTLNAPDYNSLTETQLASYMARVNYSYKDKYIATVTYRYDGASQLGEGRKWHGFPSVSLAWRIDQEPWMQVRWIDQLKLRAGWGMTGNYSVGPYATKDILSSGVAVSGSQGQTVYYMPTTFANKNITWETTQQYNVGIDFSVLKGRINGVLDLFQMYTDGLIFDVSLPPVSGYTKTKDNVGKTSNHGFDLTLNSININTRDFTWKSTLNVSFVKDKILELQSGKEDMVGSSLFIGQPIQVLYGYKSDGLWTNSAEDLAEMEKFNANGHKFAPGMVRPVDISGPDGKPDYKIDSNYDRVIIGNTRPLWNVGFTNTFTWKNWEASIFIYGNLGFVAQHGEYQGGREPVRAMNYWNENNTTVTDKMYQRPYFNTAGGDSFSGIRFQHDASYLKVRQISIAYSLPKKVVNQIGLSNVKLSAQLKNPFSIFQNAFWMDAEFGGTSFNRGLVFGVNIGF